MARKKATSNAPQAPSNLSFARRLCPSYALFHSGAWEDKGTEARWAPLKIRDEASIGLDSTRAKDDAQDNPEELASPNPQRSQVAYLPPGNDTFRMRFTLKVLSNIGRTSVCSSVDFNEKLQTIVATYAGEHTMSALAERYTHNLANARFLWRNREGAEQVQVHISHLVHGQRQRTWVFDALSLSEENFDVPATMATDLAELSQLISHTLTQGRLAILEVTAYARIGEMQEVYPSQEFVDRPKLSSAAKQPTCSKILYQLDGVAGMHTQKIGNAIRTVDTWYPKAKRPIAAEVHGAVSPTREVHRTPKSKLDFYSLLDAWVLKDIVPAPEQQHYVMSILLRGGVFGSKAKDDDPAVNDTPASNTPATGASPSDTPAEQPALSE